MRGAFEAIDWNASNAREAIRRGQIENRDKNEAKGVINRGNYRRDVFANNGAAEAFRGCLSEACGRFGWRLHAYVIMRNHFHLGVETPQPNLSDGMKWLQGTWAARFNRFRGEVGRPFQGRYKALHVEPGHALAQVVHYIHLNPVRARVVSAERLLDFKWSSLPLFVSRHRPDHLEAATLLSESGDLPDSAAGWRRYVDYLGVLAEEEPKRRGEKYGRLSRGWVIGSPEFKAELRHELRKQSGQAERFELLGGDREAWRVLRQEAWEEKLQVAARTLKVELGRMGARKSSPEKVRLAAVMKEVTGVSNGWLAERLQMGQPASVSQFVRRFRLGGGFNRRDIRGVLSRVKL